MSTLELIKFAFKAGELSPRIYGRSDLENYDMGVREAFNWFVDYRGGASTRPGTEFGDYVETRGKPTKFFEFRFSPDIANTYGILFGHKYIRFVQDNAYVLEPGHAITAVSTGATLTLTVPGHDFTIGDMVKVYDVGGMWELNNRTFLVSGVISDDIDLSLVWGAVPDTSEWEAYTGGGEVARVYTVESPYDGDDLAALRARQYRDLVRFTHKNYPRYNLQRFDADNWTLTEVISSPDIAPPASVSVSASGSGSALAVFAVTAVDANGVESLARRYQADNMVNYTVTAGSATVSWTPVPGARYYNIYRSSITTSGSNVNYGVPVGFLGRSFGVTFTDANIIPNFNITPPQYLDPFATRSIVAIEVTNGGNGYSRTDTMTVTDPDGVGFSGYPIISGGVIRAILIESGGHGYTNPSISISTSGGSGATFSIEIQPEGENYPALSTIFQQRQIYGATAARPLGIWGSRPRQFDNFDVSQALVDSDAFEFEIEAEELSPIRHLVEARGGLLVMTQTGIWLLSGGENRALTPLNALAEPHAYNGVSPVVPLKVDTDIVFIEGKGFTVRLLSYSEYTRLYSGLDVSILSSHFFSEEKQIIRWTFGHDPYRVVWAVRSDGQLLGFTLSREQEVFAWTRHATRGWFTDVISLQENVTDSVYFQVDRVINNIPVRFFERMAPREVQVPEDSWAVDAGLGLVPNYPDATLTVSSALVGDVEFHASEEIFTPAHIGDVIRVGGGKGVVTEYVSPTLVRGYLSRAIVDVQEEVSEELPRPARPGTWTLDQPVTEVRGLWHLEGETVKVLLDGSVIPDRVVKHGTITFDGESATRCTVGLGYRCVLRTLPLNLPGEVLEARRKRVTAVATRYQDTRGLLIGPTLTQLYNVKERTTESYGDPTNLLNGIHVTPLASLFDEDEGIYFIQEEPLPASILGVVFDADIGDDTD